MALLQLLPLRQQPLNDRPPPRELRPQLDVLLLSRLGREQVGGGGARLGGGAAPGHPVQLARHLRGELMQSREREEL